MGYKLEFIYKAKTLFEINDASRLPQRMEIISWNGTYYSVAATGVRYNVAARLYETFLIFLDDPMGFSFLTGESKKDCDDVPF